MCAVWRAKGMCSDMIYTHSNTQPALRDLHDDAPSADPIGHITVSHTTHRHSQSNCHNLNHKPHPIFRGHRLGHRALHSVLTPSRARASACVLAAARRSDRVRHLDGRLTLTAAMGGLDLIRTAHERSTLDDQPSTDNTPRHSESVRKPLT